MKKAKGFTILFISILVVLVLICNSFLIINGSFIYRGTSCFDSYRCQEKYSVAKDLEKIGRLKNLKNLSLLAPHVRDMSEISKLNHLEQLNLDFCMELYDWSFLSDLHSLQYLSVNRSTFHDSDLANLKELKNLKKLNINGCCFQTLDNISCCSHLEDLALMCPYVSDLSELKNMKNLHYLQISYMNIENFDFLNDLDSLESLYMSDVQIPDNEIFLMENVKELYLEDIDEPSAAFISSFPNAEIISLYNTYIDTDIITELEKLTHLKKIYVSKTALTKNKSNELADKGIEVLVCDSINNKYEISNSYFLD